MYFQVRALFALAFFIASVLQVQIRCKSSPTYIYVGISTFDSLAKTKKRGAPKDAPSSDEPMIYAASR